MVLEREVALDRTSNPNLLKLGEYCEVDYTKPLGEGGFGRVWYGTIVHTKKPVAVKQLLKTTEGIILLVERELCFLKDCSHKNVVKFFERAEDEKYFYFIMELCCHGDLDNFMIDKHVCYKECLAYMGDITCGVHYLHEQDVCHRDIKPSNILMADNGDGCRPTAKLADFGLSRVLSDSSSGNSATAKTGTPSWMAPEISVTRGVSCSYTLAVDIFSLGLLFLALVTHEIGKRLTAFTGMYF